MARVYLSYYVPAGYEVQVEASVKLCPYPGDSTATETHFGGNGNFVVGSQEMLDFVALLAIIPGSNYATTPLRQWDYAVNWVAWLASNGLQTQSPPPL